MTAQAMKSAAAEKQLELERAFEKFAHAGNKLETKYQELLSETESLRSELRAKDEEIRRSERLALLGETAAALAHEVRNPLGAIRLFLSLLQDHVEDRPAALDLLEKADKSIVALDNVVANILQFSRSKELKSAPLNLHALILEQKAAIEALPEFKGKISVELSCKPFIAGNEHGLRQAVYNIFLNACQATKFRGEIAVSAVDLPAHTLITISDNGPGLDERHIARIFDPFFTTKNEGTGLGLAVVKQIVTQHSGTITARNQEGAVFEITLPSRGI